MHEEQLVEFISQVDGVQSASVVCRRRIEAKADPRAVRALARQIIDRDGFVHVSAISGMDTGDKFVAVYHIDVEGVVISVFCELLRSNPEVESIADLVPGAGSAERELYDMFGIRVKGNESMEPLVLPDDWPSGEFPLRKDWKRTGEGNANGGAV